MIRATTGAPVRFVASIVVLWTGARVAAVWAPDLMPLRHPEQPPPPARTVQQSEWQASSDLAGSVRYNPADRQFTARTSGVPYLAVTPVPGRTRRFGTVFRAGSRPSDDVPNFASVAQLIPRQSSQGPEPTAGMRAAPPAVPFAQLAAARGRPLSFDGFIFLRRGGFADPVEPTLGGSQALVSARYSVVPRVAITGRLVSAIEGGGRPRQSEAAVGIGVRPLSAFSVELVAERRIALSDDGRDAWQLRAVGGTSVERGGWRLESYGQAGVVGMRTRDLFADGQVRVSHPIMGPVRLGAIAAGAAQPGAARLDVGPQLRVDVGAGSVPLALLLDYRVRVAGQSAPGSGPALTLATSF